MGDDPRQELRDLKRTGKLSISDQAEREATIPETKLMLMLHDLRTSNDNQFGVVFKKVDAAATHAIDAKLQAANLRSDLVLVQGAIKEVADLQKIANGSVGTLKAKVKLLESERKAEAAAMTDAVVQRHVEQAAGRGVWIINQPTKWQWTVAGCVIAFFGVDRLMAVLQWIGSLLAHLR